MSDTPQKESVPEAVVRSWGLKHVFTWTDRPYVCVDLRVR